MLTEAEKKWLEEREQYIQQYSSETFCKYCYYVKEVPKGWACDADICPTDKRDHDWQDAAEFEARVAAKLAETAGDIALLLKQAGLEQLSDWQLLRVARLAVEEEMEHGSAL